MKWKDITSYSQSAKERVPRTFEFVTHYLRVVVSNHIAYGDEIILSCHNIGIDTVGTGKTDIEDAKKIALMAVKIKIDLMSLDIEEAINDTNMQEVPSVQ